MAEAQADAALAEFLNSTVFAYREVDESAGEYQYVQRAGQSLIQIGGANFYEDLDTMIRQIARASISGVTTIRRWQANHPDTGHLYLGAVRLWTPGRDFQYSVRLRDDTR